jgi:hypothetical protein
MAKKNPVIEAVDRLKNARLELSKDYPHLDGRKQIAVNLATGAIDQAINYLLIGRVTCRPGLHTSLLFNTFRE